MAETIPSQIVMMYREDLKALLQEVIQGHSREEEYLTTGEVMAMLKISSRNTLARYHRDGLKYIKGVPNKYRKSDIDKFIKTKKII